jgi:hypothetical protein
MVRSAAALDLRCPLLAASERAPASWRRLWDLASSCAFGIVVTSRWRGRRPARLSFLIIPAVIDAVLGSHHAGPAHWLGAGTASAAGLIGSFLLDLPTGAAMVVARWRR